MRIHNALTLGAAASFVAASAVPALALQATPVPTVIVTLENAQPARGVLLTPPWIAAHDGTFDTYDGGMPASMELERIAEDGDSSMLVASFASLQPASPQLAGAAGPTGPLSPGQRVRVALNVDPMRDRYFSFVSMVIPSNDAFVGNGDPLAHPLFDNNGNFVGQDFTVSGDQSHDAGTETNDELAPNVAFLGQSAPDTGTPEGGVVQTPSPGFAAPGTLTFPDGVLNHPAFGNADFNDPDDRLLDVRFRYVDLALPQDYDARLSPRKEVQPATVDSLAKGFAYLRSVDADELRVLVLTQNLTGPIQMAHLHLGRTGTNGPIVAGVTSGILADNRTVFYIVRAADLTGPMAGASFADFLAEVAAGNVYVNVHTTAYPMGELRGQVELR